MSTFVTSAPAKLYVEECEVSSSVSEEWAIKHAASNNFILDNFIMFNFGSTQVLSNIITPYSFNYEMEKMPWNVVISQIDITLFETGTSGTTEFKLERQLAAGGAWTSLFTTNCSITSAAADGVNFEAVSGVAAPTGVTRPVIDNAVAINKGDKIRLTLVSAATTSQQLLIKLMMRPV